jgi:CAAX protease family protein
MNHEEYPTGTSMLPSESNETSAGDEVVLEPKPWGFWATAGFGLLIMAAFLAVQVVTVMAFCFEEMLRNPDMDVTELASKFENHGLLWAISTCATAALCMPLIVLFSWLRRELKIRSYLALRPVGPTVLLKWLGITLLFLIACDLFTQLLNRPAVPEYMLKAYDSAIILPLLWIALVVAAPLFEEFFFRGFLFAGFRESRLGVPGTIILTSFLWAIIHTQYDAYNLTIIFILGLLFGLARQRTGSIYPTLVLHALINLIATIQVSYYLNSH